MLFGQQVVASCEIWDSGQNAHAQVSKVSLVPRTAQSFQALGKRIALGTRINGTRAQEYISNLSHRKLNIFISPKAPYYSPDMRSVIKYAKSPNVKNGGQQSETGA